MDDQYSTAFEDPTDLRGQKRAQDRRDERARLAAKADDDDLVWLMDSKRGRRIVWRSLERAGVFRISFSTNAMSMAFAEGLRNDGIRLLLQIHTLCPDAYPLMIKEAGNAA